MADLIANGRLALSSLTVYVKNPGWKRAHSLYQSKDYRFRMVVANRAGGVVKPSFTHIGLIIMPRPQFDLYRDENFRDKASGGINVNYYLNGDRIVRLPDVFNGIFITGDRTKTFFAHFRWHGPNGTPLQNLIPKIHVSLNGHEVIQLPTKSAVPVAVR